MEQIILYKTVVSMSEETKKEVQVSQAENAKNPDHLT